MLGKRTSLILALILSVQILGGCGATGPNNANSAGSNQNASAPEPEKEGVKDNAEELGSLIRMPFEPEDLVWKEFTTAKEGEKPGRRILAVFQLTPADTRKLIELSSRIRPGIPATLSSEKWFPTELVTQSEISGDAGIQAVSYAADEFFLDPFTEGSLARVDNTDFFVLELFAK